MKNIQKTTINKVKAVFILGAFLFATSPLMAFSPGDPTDNKKTYNLAEEMPQFPGGFVALYDYLENNLEYPEACIEKNLQGKTYIKFTVETDGSISSLEVVKSSHNILDKEAIRVIQSMPKWEPGKQLNKSARVNYTIPINFVIQ